MDKNEAYSVLWEVVDILANHGMDALAHRVSVIADQYYVTEA